MAYTQNLQNLLQFLLFCYYYFCIFMSRPSRHCRNINSCECKQWCKCSQIFTLEVTSKTEYVITALAFSQNNFKIYVNSLLSGSFLINSSLSAPTKIEELTAGSVRLEFATPWVRFPAGLRCVFSSDPAVSSSIFVGAEREELINFKIFFWKTTLDDA